MRSIFGFWAGKRPSSPQKAPSTALSSPEQPKRYNQYYLPSDHSLSRRVMQIGQEMGLGPRQSCHVMITEDPYSIMPRLFFQNIILNQRLLDMPEEDIIGAIAHELTEARLTDLLTKAAYEGVKDTAAFAHMKEYACDKLAAVYVGPTAVIRSLAKVGELLPQQAAFFSDSDTHPSMASRIHRLMQMEENFEKSDNPENLLLQWRDDVLALLPTEQELHLLWLTKGWGRNLMTSSISSRTN